MHNALMTEMHERLAWAREQAGFDTASDAANALNIPGTTYMGHENGSRGFRSRAEQYSKRFKVSLEWLLTGRGSHKKGIRATTHAVGYVGAGAEIFNLRLPTNWLESMALWD